MQLQLSAMSVSLIRRAPAASVATELEDAAEDAIGRPVEWVDGCSRYTPVGSEWAAYGHVYIGGVPHDVCAVYAVSMAGAVTAAHVTTTVADLG